MGFVFLGIWVWRSIGRVALERQHWKDALEGQHWKGNIGENSIGRTAFGGSHWESAVRKGSIGMGLSIERYPGHYITFFMLCIFCARANIISLYVLMALSRACGQDT